VFVGRDRELAELDQALERARSSRGGLYLIAGEPGIGKTRLAAEVAERAERRGMHVCWGRCWEAGGAPALWPFREVLDGLGLALPRGVTIAASEGPEARFALFQAIARTLAERAADAPLLLVLEDLHAADRTTLLLLERLAAQLHALPIVVIGTYRELEASLRDDIADVHVRAGRHGPILALGHLRAEDVTALVRDRLHGADAELAATVYDTTQGNPLFVHEIVRDLHVRGPAPGSPLPLGVREVIRQRLGLIAPPARRVLEAAAVLGVELRATDVAQVIEGAEAVLDDAVRTHLLVARADRLRFAHALYREALYLDLPRERRHELHRASARALARAGAPLAEIAHHLLEAAARSRARPSITRSARPSTRSGCSRSKMPPRCSSARAARSRAGPTSRRCGHAC
jgi:predicted ATPase